MPRVVHHSISVPLDRSGFSGWNLMLTESRQPQLTSALYGIPQCFAKETSERIMRYTLVSHTNVHAIRGRPTLKDVERFQNGSVPEFCSLKALKTSKMWIPQILKNSQILMSRTWMLREKTTSKAPHWIKNRIFNETTWTANISA